MAQSPADWLLAKFEEDLAAYNALPPYRQPEVPWDAHAEEFIDPETGLSSRCGLCSEKNGLLYGRAWVDTTKTYPLDPLPETW